MKVGDKYVIEIEEVIRRNGAPQIARVKGFNTLVFDKCGLEKLEPYENAKREIYLEGYNAGYGDGKSVVEMPEIDKRDIADAYNKGLNDAWELVKRIESIPDKGGLTNAQIEEVFGRYWTSYSLYNEFSADEALDLYKRWEDKQKQYAIQVGDEVYSDTFDDKGIVTHITADICIICNGSTMMKVGTNGLHKTGRHFDAIAEVLAELRGEE